MLTAADSLQFFFFGSLGLTFYLQGLLPARFRAVAYSVWSTESLEGLMESPLHRSFNGLVEYKG